MVISILNPKGGVGKTTLATNISRALQPWAEDVLLLDMDPQQSAQEWAARNPDDYPGVLGVQQDNLLQIIPKVKNRFDLIIIDGAAIMGPRSLTDAIRVSDAVLIPVQPSGLDIWGTADLIELITTRQSLTNGRPKAAFVVSRQVQGTRFATDIHTRLEQMDLPVFTSRLTQRIAFAEAASIGQSVLDYQPAGKAAQDIHAITEELQRFTHAKDRS